MDRRLYTREEYEKYMKTYKDGKCPFCDWPHEQIVLHEGKNWVWIYNRFPYWKAQTMIIPKRHFKEITEASLAEVAEMMEMYRYAIDRFHELKIGDRYVMFWRLRDREIDSISGMKRSTHFHVNLVPDKDHAWDPILDHDATKFNFEVLTDEFNANDNK